MVGESHGLDSQLHFVIKSFIAPQCSCREQYFFPVLPIGDKLNKKISLVSYVKITKTKPNAKGTSVDP